MLEQIRKSGASIFIYLIFGLLIVIFVINFAPNAGSGTGGCSGGGVSAVQVDGEKTNQTAYKIAYSGNNRSGRDKTYAALELIIRRELLAQAAEARGIRVTDDLLDEEIKKGNFFLGGNRNELDFWIDNVDGERFFNFQKLKSWVGTLNVSMNSYKDEQKRNLQATLMAELLESSVRVSREEALAAYLFENNTVTYDAVTFSPAAYRDAMRLTEADVARFITTHEDEVKKKWGEVEREYKGTKPSLKLRSIFVASAAPATKPAEAPTPAPGAGSGSAAPAAGAGSGSAAAATPTTPADTATAAKPADNKPSSDEAKAKLEAARAQIAAGKLKFADAAKQLATDEAAKANGGEIGWRSVDNAQLGDKAVNDAVKALKPGEMTPVIATDAGVWLVMAEDKREGDLTYDQVKIELATDLARDVWSKEAAKRAALDALASARAGTGKNLDQVFERQTNEDQQRRQMQQMIEEQLRQQQGSITWESNDIPASWTAQEDPATPGAGSATGTATGSTGATAGSAAKPATTTTTAKPTATATGAGSAAAPTTGAGSGSATAPTTPPTGAGSGSAAPTATPTATTAETPATGAPAAADLTPSKDVLPSFGELSKPKVMSYGPVPRMKQLPAVGDSTAAINALFDELNAGMLAKQVYETNGNYVLVQLTEKSAPKVEDFDKVASKEIEDLRANRAAFMLNEWLKDRCQALAKDGKIKPMADLIRETDDAGKTLPTVYQPCMSFR